MNIFILILIILILMTCRNLGKIPILPRQNRKLKGYRDIEMVAHFVWPIWKADLKLDTVYQTKIKKIHDFALYHMTHLTVNRLQNGRR